MSRETTGGTVCDNCGATYIGAHACVRYPSAVYPPVGDIALRSSTEFLLLDILTELRAIRAHLEKRP